MKFYIKRSIDIFDKKNIVKFCYNVVINDTKNGFEEFDLGNEEYKIDSLLKKLDNDFLTKMNNEKPIYISLSYYFFNNLIKLYELEFETENSISKITRNDL